MDQNYTPRMPVCPNCGEENPARARFCLNCGAPLAGAAPTTRKERKFAAALFADVVGSTALAERQDPEVVQAVINRAFDRLSQEVERFGGVVEKFMGDAILAVFGVPNAHEDDPERAVRAAIEMQALLGELNRSFIAEHKPRLEMRIGVEAGEVLVDVDRVAGPRERMLTGDAVNTAARLQTAGEPPQVLVGPAIHSATKDVIDYRELPPLTLKGKEHPVPAWQALRIKARRRGERPRLGLEAHLVGRDEEFAVLQQTFHRVESEGRPALVTILGTAGVGKSRLASELLAYLESLKTLAYWRKGRCLAYGNVSYSALADAVKAQCEILEDDPPEIAAEKVRTAVEELFGDAEIVPHVRALIGAAEEGPRFSREELFDAWRRFLERMAARLPLVLVLEDLHWADAGLLDFVDHLANWARGPILVLALARPELLDLRPGWGGGKRNYSAIYLDPLTPEESSAMLEDLLGGALPEKLRRLVTERTEGVPLFAEEIVRMFIDRGVLRATEAKRWELSQPVDSVDVPRSINALIATRLDGLPLDEKELLQDAAVIGRAFWAGAVVGLSNAEASDVRAALGRLRVKELITPTEPSVFSGELEFAFRHVLIRDVAYESLPKALRAAKHVEVARWAEERAGERAEELAEVVAAHYLHAIAYREELDDQPDPDLDLAASRWASIAGGRAMRLWQQAEAYNWYTGALRLGRRAGSPLDELASLTEAAVRASMGSIPFAESQDLAQKGRELFEAIGDERGMARMEHDLAFASFNLGEHSEVPRWSERSIDRLEPFGDSVELASVLDFYGNFLRRQGRDADAEPLLRRALSMADRMGERVIAGHAAVSLGIVLVQLGDVAQGMEMTERGYATAQEAGELELMLRASNNLVSLLMDYAPDYPRGWRIIWRGIELSQRSGRRDIEGWLWQNAGNYAFDEGKLDVLEQVARMTREIGETLSDHHIMQGAGYYLGVWEFLRGNLQAAEDALARSFIERPELQALPYVYSLEGDIQEARGRREDAIDAYRRAVESAHGDLMLGMVDEALGKLIRSLALADRAREAEPLLADLRRSARGGRTRRRCLRGLRGCWPRILGCGWSGSAVPSRASRASAGWSTRRGACSISPPCLTPGAMAAQPSESEHARCSKNAASSPSPELPEPPEPPEMLERRDREWGL